MSDKIDATAGGSLILSAIVAVAVGLILFGMMGSAFVAAGAGLLAFVAAYFGIMYWALKP